MKIILFSLGLLCFLYGFSNRFPKKKTANSKKMFFSETDFSKSFNNNYKQVDLNESTKLIKWDKNGKEYNSIILSIEGEDNLLSPLSDKTYHQLIYYRDKTLRIDFIKPNSEN